MIEEEEEEGRRKKSLQEMYAPKSICFGCGPANPDGLHIRSYVEGDDKVVTDWTPNESHHAFEGVLNGGIIGTLLDCHSNWTAAEFLRWKMGLEGTTPPTVTAEFQVRFLKPTPIGVVLHVSARVVGMEGKRVTVEAELSAGGSNTATFRGTFVVVSEGHPAYGRWMMR